ncbi:MAG: hypothetical protein KDA31_00815 [Phycisphaerales bacterium]|nr:hypothetical protein [Phycisphaerales bacterium]MCB9837443.1 hypothetical protein [Phycisphaera sp.]
MSATSKSSATRKMRIAQVAGLCMVALAAGAVMFKPGLPDRPAPANQSPVFGGEEPTNNAKSNSRYEFDADMSGDGLNKAGKTIIETKTDETDTEFAEIPKPDPVTPETRGWMYLGGVFEPKTNFAFVSINGTQRMLKQGTYLPEYDATVVSVEPGKIEIEREGMREQITLAKPTETLVSVSSPTAQPIGNGGLNVPGRQLTPADSRVMQREEFENNPDIDKRRAEFLRRQREREGIDR